jgi:hypothetical protein
MKPLQEGVGSAKQLNSDAAAGAPLQQLKSGASLAELQKDYAIFTYAPLFLVGGLEHNPIQEWINAHNHKQIVSIIPLRQPVIHLGFDPIWDSTLWAVETAYWPSLRLHVGSLAVINRHKKQLTRVVCQEVQILDGALRDDSFCLLPSLPVQITTFSVDSNLACLAFMPATLKTKWQPYLKLYPAREETVKLCAALLGNSPAPYNNIQPMPWESI